jgi:uncharacterized protein YxeA
MNKKIIIIVVLILLLGGGVFVLSQNKNGASSGNIVSTVKDAVSKTASMQCDYTDEQGRVSKTYIKNGAVRSDYTGKTAQDSGSVIVTGKKMYMWTADKKGFSYDIPEVTVTPGQNQAPESGNKKDEFMSGLDKYKDSCKAAIVSDSLFTPPSDVTFTDYSEMQKMMMSPKGTQGMTEEQMKQYQQQYMDKMPTGEPDQNSSY